MVLLYDPMGDRQAETGATRLAASGWIGAIEALENMGELLGRDADPGIVDFEHGGPACGVGMDPYGSRGFRVFDGIIDEDQGQATQRVGISHHQ